MWPAGSRDDARLRIHVIEVDQPPPQGSRRRLTEKGARSCRETAEIMHPIALCRCTETAWLVVFAFQVSGTKAPITTAAIW